MRLVAQVVAPAVATAVVPLAWSPPLASTNGSLAVLALSIVTLAGLLGWLCARATVERRAGGSALLTSTAVALFSPFGGSLLVPAALALLRFREDRSLHAANDNLPAMDRGHPWVPITPARARVLLDGRDTGDGGNVQLDQSRA